MIRFQGAVCQVQSSLFSDKNISYDALDQIRQEGDRTYLFDSIGNPSNYETNDCNEVLSTQESVLSYDLDGNLIKRVLKDKTIFYTYDALNRLTSITYPQEKKILYSYDPFSRLFSKETFVFEGHTFQKMEKVFLIHDQNREIGTLNEEGKILQLKVLGLGLGAEIGAAVAIELNESVYAPLHDFNGNCIALLSSSGKLVERYQIDAFGKEISTPSSPQNPWRFSSKRQEEGLVFFGLRCYDLALERWLTPDPAGFADGPNLYVYVRNSPLNRLDLFGLTSLEKELPIIEVTVASILSNLGKRSLIPAVAIVDGVRIDWVVSCGHWHQLQFSADEIKSGKIDLLQHFSELVPEAGSSMGVITLQNGICTTLPSFKQMAQSFVDKVPEGTLFIGMHNPSESLFKDLSRVSKELKNIETSVVRTTSQMMGAIAETIHKINPSLGWLEGRHSEGGMIGRRAIERLTEDQRNILKNQYNCIALGPAQLIPDSYGQSVYNIYSDKDYVTRFAAKKQHDGFKYNVRFVECKTAIRDRTVFLADHPFMGLTYQKALDGIFEGIREERGFYNAKER